MQIRFGGRHLLPAVTTDLFSCTGADKTACFFIPLHPRLPPRQKPSSSLLLAFLSALVTLDVAAKSGIMEASDVAKLRRGLEASRDAAC